MKPADLKPGHRINAHTTLTVYADPHIDIDATNPNPDLDRVYIDVEATGDRRTWDPIDIPEATGAEAYAWLGGSPLRYRLAFLPDADVTVEETL
jgi:hypothetical protein